MAYNMWFDMDESIVLKTLVYNTLDLYDLNAW